MAHTKEKRTRVIEILKKIFGKIFRKKTFRRRIGDAGERIAEKRLKDLGLRILQKNFVCGRDEIDIVVLDKQTLVFVEVKTRTGKQLVNGYFAATQNQKRTAIKRCAKAYLNALRVKPAAVRFDIVDIEFPKATKDEQSLDNPKVLHYENAYY